MSTVKPTYGDPALGGTAITRDQARELLGQVMGYVAVTVGFAALGAYLGRDLSGATGLVLFIGAFACIIGLNVATAKGREQLAIVRSLGKRLLLCAKRADDQGPVPARRQEVQGVPGAEAVRRRAVTATSERSLSAVLTGCSA